MYDDEDNDGEFPGESPVEVRWSWPGRPVRVTVAA